MAWMRELKQKCQQQSCPKTATHEVFNSRNGGLGVYCQYHGARRVSILDARENAPAASDPHVYQSKPYSDG